MLSNNDIFEILFPKPKIPLHHDFQNKCIECKKSSLINDQGQLVCTNCGTLQEAILVVEVDKTELGHNSQSVYLRKNHFSDFLRRIQGEQKTVIPNDLITELKQKFTTEPSQRQLRKVLPKCYNRSIHLIYNLCWNKELPHFNSQDIERFQRMFNKVSEVSKQLYNLKHFFHIHYLLYQFCILLKTNQYIKFIDKVKNIKTINRYNTMWKKICEKLDWHYNPY